MTINSQDLVLRDIERCKEVRKTRFADYYVSYSGEVYSKKFHWLKNPKQKLKQLTASVNSHGYRKVGLKLDKGYKHIAVHRLVAETFIPNENKYPCVNHINGLKNDNRVCNLEWCDYKHNNVHAAENNLIPQIAVRQLSLDGNEIAIYRSQIEAARQTGLHHQAIYQCLKGIISQTGGYKWEKVEKYPESVK